MKKIKFREWREIQTTVGLFLVTPKKGKEPFACCDITLSPGLPEEERCWAFFLNK